MIKIDVKGAEIEVLRGAWNSILNYRPYLIVELYVPRNRFKAFSMLKEAGYVVKHIEEANYLFIPRA